jgi:F-type H+-transporting ATPase subunit b
LEQLGLNLGYLIVQIVCFFIIFVVVRAWIVKPLMNMLEKRRSKLEQGLEDSRVAAEARANAEKEAEKILGDAQLKATHLLNDASDRANGVVEERKVQFEKDMARERETALADVQEERNRLLADLRGQVAALSIAAAQKLIGEAMDSKKQHALLDEFFSGVKSGKVILLEGADLVGNATEVTSALPLTKEEQETVRKNLLGKLGSKTGINFHVEPQILGGLIIRVGDKIVDGSVLGQLEEMRKTLK